MAKKVIAIVGSYRKGGITDQAVDTLLEVAQQKGIQAKKFYLIDRHIEFCTNCRLCTQQPPAQKRAKCIHSDSMVEILSGIDSADTLILAAPINFFNVTAIMKRFIERLLVYAYWPWGENSIPKNRIKKLSKKAVLITSSACPAFFGRILMPGALKLLKITANTVGAKVIKSFYFGMACATEKQRLSEKQIKKLKSAGNLI